MYVSVQIEPEKTREIEDYIRIKLPEIINEAIFADKNVLNNIIRECVKSQMRAIINDLMQGKDFRDFLRDKVMEEIGMK